MNYSYKVASRKDILQIHMLYNRDDCKINRLQICAAYFLWQSLPITFPTQSRYARCYAIDKWVGLLIGLGESSKEITQKFAYLFLTPTHFKHIRTHTHTCR